MIIATLIAADRLTQEHIRAATDALDRIGLRPVDGDLQERGSAVDFLVHETADLRPAEVRIALGSALSDVDVIVQLADHRRKRLLVADMDSTMIAAECIDELASYAGLKREVAAVTERAMRGELDFVAALEARTALLAGLETEAIDRCLRERVRMTPGARTLVATMRARGATCLLVSGGFTRFAEPVGAELGFNRVIANELVVADGKLTGEVKRPIVGAAAKQEALAAAAAELGLAAEQTLAVGDGANDIPMLQAAGLGIAYRAKPAVREAASACIDHNDLTALLYAQGIPKAEWVTG